jgi:hypothetical protein
MEKPSKRNLFDDDSDEADDYKPGVPQPDAEDEMYKPQADEMEEVKIDSTPVTQEQTTNDEYQP